VMRPQPDLAVVVENVPPLLNQYSVTLVNPAAHPGVRRWYAALAAACDAVGTPQIRNMATLGGNLCQRNRCWYFRQHVPCHKTGGRGCPAVEGLNEYLGILGGGPCHAPHPSDPAVALAALDARVHVRWADPGRKPGVTPISIGTLYSTAAKRRDAETILKPGDVIERISVPGAYAGARQVYRKATQRAEWDQRCACNVTRGPLVWLADVEYERTRVAHRCGLGDAHRQREAGGAKGGAGGWGAVSRALGCGLRAAGPDDEGGEKGQDDEAGGPMDNHEVAPWRILATLAGGAAGRAGDKIVPPRPAGAP